MFLKTAQLRSIAAGVLLFACHVSGDAVYTLEKTADGMRLKTADGKVIFEYLTNKPAGSGLTSESAACFHPLLTPSGERITSLAPDDHPHHRGLFFGWQDSEFREVADFTKYGPRRPQRGWNIDRADFWGWGEYAPRQGRVIRNRTVELVRATADSAQLRIENDWTVASKKLLEETNLVTASEREGVFVIDLEYRLAPLADYVLNRAAF